jgi:preprotein translocase subunit SecE
VIPYGLAFIYQYTGVAQLVEQWSPKPKVESSNLSARARKINLSIQMSGIVTYIEETVYELKHKVTWPTWKELQSSSVIVLVASAMIALAIFGMDYVFGVNSSDSWWKGILGWYYKL